MQHSAAVSPVFLGFGFAVFCFLFTGGAGRSRASRKRFSAFSSPQPTHARQTVSKTAAASGPALSVCLACQPVCLQTSKGHESNQINQSINQSVRELQGTWPQHFDTQTGRRLCSPQPCGHIPNWSLTVCPFCPSERQTHPLHNLHACPSCSELCAACKGQGKRSRQEVNGSNVLGSPCSLFLGLLFSSTMGGCCAFASWTPDLTLPSSLPVDFRLGLKLAGLSDQNGREWTSVVRDAAVELSCLRSVTSGKILFDCSSVYFGLQRLQYSALLVSQLHSLSG